MSEALKLADFVDSLHFPTDFHVQARAELRRQHEEITQLRHGAGVANHTIEALAAQRDELLELLVALRRIAMASEATVCNQEWVAKTARAAITKAEQEK